MKAPQLPAFTAASEQAASPERRLAVRLTLGYIVALTLIALLSGATHILLDRVIVQQHDSATVINVAGRQRMLSQRIGMLSTDLLEGDTAARGPLLAAVKQMERAHLALVHRNDLGISSDMSPRIKAMFFDTKNSLNDRVTAFTDAADRFRMAPNDPRNADNYALIHWESRGELLGLLNQVVLALEEESRQRIGWLQTVQQGVFIIMLITLALEAMLIFRPLVARVQNYAAHLYKMATRDSLTGLPNRRHFRETVERELLLARRSGQPIALLGLDIDFFKKVNDTYGHATGDAVLVRFGDILQQSLRRSDTVGRLGGEEFAVLLPGADHEAASIIAEKLRAAVEAYDGSAENLPHFTVSIGVTTVNAARDTLDALLAHADLGLYEAKRNGRNCVMMAT